MFKYVLGEDGQVVPVPHGPYELNNWKRKADTIENRYSKRMGIVTGPVEVIFHVDMLKGMRHTDEGALIKEYDYVPGVDTDYAAQTVVWDVISEDQRYIEKAPLPITEDFPVGAKAFFLGEYNFGRPLEVIGHHENTVDVWVHTMVKPGNAQGGQQRPSLAVKEPEFTKEIVRDAESITKYKPAYRLARELKINPLVLSKITSSFQAMVDGKRLNLGLNLKFEAKQRKVLGYSRKNEGGWEFSVKAEELIREYMIKFPQFFERLMANPNGDLYRDTDFYDPSESKAKIEEITKWLKSVDARGLERVPLEAEQLEAEVVMMIQGAIDSFDQGIADARRINKVPRKALLKPLDAEHRLADQRFTIGDRVVYVQESGKVPIGARGTVVGLTRTTRQTLLDVVWDITFMAGTTLGNRCSPFRGMTVPVSSVLNLTSRQLISSTKASDRRANAVKPAPAPPPLTASYADATLGNVSNNAKPQPTLYPPPTSLNGYQGRGRGGFRGRGGHAQNQNQSPQQQQQQQQQNGGPANGPARGGFAPRGTTILSRRGGPPGQPQVMQRPRGGGVPGLVVPSPPQQIEQQVQQQAQQQVQQVQQSQQVQQPQRQPQGPQQQQFQNMPPPTNFNRGRGRGRGSGARGRGAQFRGRGGAGAQPQGENGETQ
jgi:5'-3' exoribonuclease 1